MPECKRYGCTYEGHPALDGYCSTACRDVGELEEEIAELRGAPSKKPWRTEHRIIYDAQERIVAVVVRQDDGDELVRAVNACWMLTEEGRDAAEAVCEKGMRGE